MATDVEISRALNALDVTLNDQRLEQMDLGRLQEIATLALGGEPHLEVVDDPEHARGVALVRDTAGHVVGRVELADGHWTVSRRGAPLSGGYVPSAG